jgi:hypothetical protein
MKKYLDDEGIVIGYTSGREGKEGRLLGLMGNVILRLKNGKTLEISGFRAAEREMVIMDGGSASAWLRAHPDTVVPDRITSILFPRGTEINFRFRDLTNDGIPIEAHYNRVREAE